MAVVCFLCVLSVGCSGKGKPTQSNFDKIGKGMSIQQVEELMGPAKTSLDMKHAMKGNEDVLGMPKYFIYVWEEGDIDYLVTFIDDTVKDKASGPKEEMKKRLGGK